MIQQYENDSALQTISELINIKTILLCYGI